MTARGCAIATLASVVLLLASCGASNSETEDSPPAPEQVTTEAAETPGRESFTADSLEQAVAELGVVCEGGWTRAAEYNDCIDMKYSDAWFTIVDPPDYDTMTAHTGTYPHPVTAVWNDEVGFIYSDSWADDWLDPLIADCVAGESACYMQSGKNDPFLMND